MRFLVIAVMVFVLLGAAGCGTSDEDEIRAVVKELQRSTADKKDAKRACALLTPRAAAQITGFLGTFAGGGGSSCVEVLGKTEPDDTALTTEFTIGDIERAKLAIRGDLALADFGKQRGAIGLARVDGVWRVDNILNPSLEPRQRRIDPRLGRGSDRRQLLATYQAIGAAFAARDYPRVCSLASYGAEAQLVVGRLFAALGGNEDESARPDLSCPASLKAIGRLEGAMAAFANASPSAADLAAADVIVDGRRATVKVPGADPAYFLREEGRWLMAPEPSSIEISEPPTPRALERCWRRAGAAIASTADDLRFAAGDKVRGTTIAPGRTSVKGPDWRVFYAHQRGDVDPGLARVIARPSAVPVVAYVRDAPQHADVVGRARDCG